MFCRLYYQDSRGLAAMLKELSKSGHGQQALELFDWLQSLPPSHDLAPLADVFSFTTGVAAVHGAHQLDPITRSHIARLRMMSLTAARPE